MIWWHSGAGTRLWRRPAGPQSSCMRSGHCRCQGLADLSGWRLHKYRLADLRGSDTRTASCTARPKHGVRLSWGRSETSKKIKNKTHKIWLFTGFGAKSKLKEKKMTSSRTSWQAVFFWCNTSNSQWPGPRAPLNRRRVTQWTPTDLFLHTNTHRKI